MQILSIYKDFKLIGETKAYKSLRWTRRYQRPGDFKLLIPVSQENIALLREGDIITLGSDREGAFIEDINTMTYISGKQHIDVSGYFLSSLLNRRIVPNLYEETDITTGHIMSLLNENILNPKDPARKIPNLRIVEMDIKDKESAVSYRQKPVGNGISELLTEVDCGYKILFNQKERMFDMYFYQGKQTDAVFSENYKNIIRQDYFEYTSRSKNVCYILEDDIETAIGSVKGLDRREVGMSSNSQSLDSLEEQGTSKLREVKARKSFDTSIDDLNQQFIYRKDWDLGDVVTNESALYGITMESNVLEVVETYDRSGRSIDPLFGDLL